LLFGVLSFHCFCYIYHPSSQSTYLIAMKE